jgi:small-conductance mechanosensitive channel
MTNARRLPALALHSFRPAIADAKLMTEKQARDAVYVASLAEELAAIDRKLSAMEQVLHPESLQNRDCAGVSDPAPEEDRSAQWVRTKCRELDSRLHRIAGIEKRIHRSAEAFDIQPK